MDHNDIAFGFYVLASFWSYSEYLRRNTIKWIVLTGVFAGCAILNKWLTGLLVFAPWGISSILQFVKTKRLDSFSPLLKSFAICFIVFMPWQIYILTHFHDLAINEYAYNARHIWEVLEGHRGDMWYYLNSFPEYFGNQVNYLVPIGFVLLIFRKSISIPNKILLILPATIVFCFFSFIVQSKIKAYFFVAAPICFIYSGIALSTFVQFFEKYKLFVAFPLLLLSIYWTLDLKSINDYTFHSKYRANKLHNVTIYKQLDRIIPSNIDVVINTNEQEHVDIMFYSKRLEAYHNQISQLEFESISKYSLPVAAFASRANYVLPSYINTYKGLYIIDAKLK